MIGMKSEGTVVEHTGRKVAHDRFGLNMEVAEHLVGAPAAHEADEVGVHFSAKEGHGPRSVEGTGGDIGGEESEGGTEDGGGQAENQCDDFRKDGERLGMLEVLGKRSLPGGVMIAEVEDAAGKAEDRAKLGVAAFAEANDFATNAVFLVGELKRSKGCGPDGLGCEAV